MTKLSNDQWYRAIIKECKGYPDYRAVWVRSYSDYRNAHTKLFKNHRPKRLRKNKI